VIKAFPRFTEVAPLDFGIFRHFLLIKCHLDIVRDTWLTIHAKVYHIFIFLSSVLENFFYFYLLHYLICLFLLFCCTYIQSRFLFLLVWGILAFIGDFFLILEIYI